MLRLAKVHQGGERYYFQTVAATTDLPDGLIERDPFWLGRGAAGLGLEGIAARSDVRAVLAGAAPGTGEALATRPRDNLAYDIVLSVPKSVSLLHALASPELSARIEDAHLAATAATWSHLEENVLRIRRSAGSDDARSHWNIGIEGAIAMAAVHRTSRAADPHLHTHLVVANLAEGIDGRWWALDGRPLYGRQCEVRALFEAQLRYELTGLGIDFGPMRGDFADVALISQATITEFSRQSRAIAAAVKESGVVTREDADVLARAIRPEKDRSRPYEELVAEWRERGYRLGLSQNRIDRAAGLGAVPGRTLLRSGGSRRDDPAWVEAAAGRYDGTFSRSDLVVARCCALREGGTMADVQASVDAALASPDVVAARQPGRYTTTRQLEIMCEAAERVGSLARETGAMVLTFDSEDARGRAAGLAAASGAQANGERAVFSVAPGERAAERFEAATGIESVPVKHAHLLEGRLGRGDVLLVADCGIMLEAELAAAMAMCRAVGATPLLFGAERAMADAPVLDVVRAEAPRVEIAPELLPERDPTPASVTLHDLGPGMVATALPDVPSACDALLVRAGELEATGHAPMIVVPDRSLKAEVAARAELSGTSVPIVESSRVSAALASRARASRPAPSLVVLGSEAPMHLRQDRLAGLERTHVVVVPGAGRDSAKDLAAVTKAMAPRSLRSERVAVRPERELEVPAQEREPGGRERETLGRGLGR